MHNELSLTQRLGALLIYVASLLIISGILTGIWIPDGSGRSLWLLAAIGMLLFTRLTAPYFAPPRDALVNSVTNVLLLATIDLRAIDSTFGFALNSFRVIALVFAVFVSACAITSIALYQVDSHTRPGLTLLKKLAHKLTDRLGRGALLFTPLALISIVGFYQGSPVQQAWLVAVWSILVFIEPVDLVLRVIQDVKDVRRGQADLLAIGDIQRIDDPNILRVRLRTPNTWKQSRIHIAQLPDSRQVEVLPLFVQTQGAELIGTGLCHNETSETIPNTSVGLVYYSASTRNAEQLLSELAGGEALAKLVGFVVEKSKISQIRFEVASAEELQEGWLVFSQLAGERVYYQILDAQTAEESFDQNPRGAHIAIAQQLGSLVIGEGFRKCGWLPPMNAPVFLAPKDSGSVPNAAASGTLQLGVVPNTAIPVVASLNDMFEYHTAILGATGTGKTELAYDLIRSAVKDEVKVICVDFTGEYRTRLREDLSPAKLGLTKMESRELQERIFDVETTKFGTEEKRVLETFVSKIAPNIERQVHEFLETTGGKIGIFELEEIANSKATLRATELYLSTVFRWARRNRTGQRILLVLEEAHTIIPETNLYGFDRVETSAVVGRMAQIALQGRKYGVGILLISQRTALVSKTLLSQCNTVLCFAMHDETGLKYMANVFDRDHVAAIPNLKPLQGVAFGKAVRSDYPILFDIPYDEKKKRASEALRAGLTENTDPQGIKNEDPCSDVFDEEIPPEASEEIVPWDPYEEEMSF